MSSFELQRRAMVEDLKQRGILRSPEVIRAMGKVPREEFVPVSMRRNAYQDTPLPILANQTVSAPHMVAMMCEALELREGLRLLEVGVGSGYHAAVASEALAPEFSTNPGHVYGVEFHRELVEFAKANLERTSYASRVTVIEGDGTLGVEEYAPYDRIMATAAAPRVPPPLLGQLKEGGILVAPVGEPYTTQVLQLLRKGREGRMEVRILCSVAFVPMVGKYGWRELRS